MRTRMAPGTEGLLAEFPPSVEWLESHKESRMMTRSMFEMVADEALRRKVTSRACDILKEKRAEAEANGIVWCEFDLEAASYAAVRTAEGEA